MIVILGIDIGGTTTDLAGFVDNTLLDVLSVKASDPLASASGALGKFINKHNLPLDKIKKIAITGVGSSFIDMNLFGIETVKINEFTSIGLGGTYLVQADKAIVVSMGTGTAFVRVENGKVKHLGGTGVGGGTLMGLSKEILHTLDFNKILEMTEKGDLGKVDLRLADISQEEIGSLLKWITVSNFGKSSDDATKEDLAAGIFNMVFQTIGMLSIFAARMEGDKNIIFTGQLANIPYGQRILKSLIKARLFEGNFEFPEYAEYSTAIGAAICLMRNNI
ncbi:MAG TPA: pantothenate kinase [Halanaerobiaceae bacterium]|jgi:type II pantothenate kinase|nr:BadF/BadG/BcrA/BcrD ATPase family protein [Bacillota bacterium]HHU92398.1 pantothenate kinase [Halanaerobiaceae bacterium]